MERCLMKGEILIFVDSATTWCKFSCYCVIVGDYNCHHSSFMNVELLMSARSFK